MRQFTARLTPADWVSYAFYILLSVLTVLFHGRIPSAPRLLAGHLGFLALFTLLVSVNRPDSPPILALLRTALPLIYTFLIYRQMELYMRIFHDRWLDPQVVALELRILRVHPTLWLERIVRPWLTETLKLVYTVYYLLLLALPLALFLQRRRAELDRWLFTMMLALAVCYIGFTIVPAVGPRYYWGGQLFPGRIYPFPPLINPAGNVYRIPVLQGYWITALLSKVMSSGDCTGGCIPSVHNAAAIVILVGVRRCYPRLFAVTLLLVIGICFSTVYNRFHYATDMVSGISVGLIAAGIAALVYRRRMAADGRRGLSTRVAGRPGASSSSAGEQSRCRS